MANLKVDTISGIGTEGPVLNGGLHFRSKNYLTLPKGTTTERIATSSGISTVIGAIRYNTDSNKMECYVNNKWMIVSTSSPNLDGGARGVFHSGRTASGTAKNNIDFITIESTGNAIDFGDSTQLTEANNTSCVSSRTRGLYAGGYLHPTGHHDQIGFITISSTGNSADFGNLTQSRRAIGGVSNATRGVFCGGLSPTPRDTVDFVTIASIGNAVDFGNLTQARQSGTGMSSPTRGVLYGGYFHPSYAANEFITIATTGNAQEFGDALVNTSNRYNPSGISNSTRGLVAGGVTGPGTITKYIESIIMATLGNGVNFGDLSTTTRSKNGTASPTRGVFAGGRSPADSDSSPSGPVNGIEYVSMQTEGNAVDFGDLTQARYEHNPMGNAHGGL